MNLKFKRLLDLYLGSALLLVIKPLVYVVGKVLRRDHDLRPRGNIAVIKMLGGGSLIIAFPALLGIRLKYPDKKMVLFTSNSVKPFAESLNVFDEIYTLSDKSVVSLFISGIRLIPRFLSIDTFLDFEVYSRLSTLITLFSLARNRIGFYLESTHWREYIQTHLVYFNQASGTFNFYERVASLLEAPAASMSVCRKHFIEFNKLVRKESPSIKTVAIGAACSDLGRERMLNPEAWALLLKAGKANSQYKFLGGPSDFNFVELIKEQIVDKSRFDNLAGKRSLIQSVETIYNSDEYWGVDSGLLHYARLVGTPSISYWGPTAPATRLKSIDDYKEQIFYKKLICSPCVHITSVAPCGNDNKCMKNLFNENYSSSIDEIPISSFKLSGSSNEK